MCLYKLLRKILLVDNTWQNFTNSKVNLSELLASFINITIDTSRDLH